MLFYFVYNWMGGEPLLALDVIEKLTMGALEIAAKREVEFSAKIITNGYLLTPAVAEKLVQDFKVDFFQITLDGMANTHNRKRPSLNGDPTTLPECPECKVFPLCLGGYYWKRDFTPDEPCSMSKFDLEETLKTYVQNKLYLDNQPRR